MNLYDSVMNMLHVINSKDTDIDKKAAEVFSEDFTAKLSQELTEEISEVIWKNI